MSNSRNADVIASFDEWKKRAKWEDCVRQPPRPETLDVQYPEPPGPTHVAGPVVVANDIDKANGPWCRENICKEEGGCAGCVEFIAVLGAGERVERIETWTIAGGGDGDVPIREVPWNTEFGAWFLIETPQTSTNESGHQVVRSHYINRSHTRVRRGELRISITRSAVDTQQRGVTRAGEKRVFVVVENGSG